MAFINGIELIPWLVTALVLFLGCCVQAALGFGMAIIAAPVVMLVAPHSVPYALTSTALLVSLLTAWDQRRAIRWQVMIPAMVSRIPGTVIGAWVLLTISVMWLHLFVSLAVLVAVLISLMPLRFDATPKRLAWAGFVSGFMGTTTSIGGPPMALVMQFGAPVQVRASLSMYFAFACVVSLFSYAAVGLFSMPLLWQCLSFMPMALLGFFCGKRLQGWVDHGRFRILLLTLCFIASAIALGGVVMTFVNHS